MTAPKAKRCPRCGQVKPLSAFYRRRGTRTSPYCQPCTGAASREARRRQDPTSAGLLRTVDRSRQRRRRALRNQLPDCGDAA
jgi:hypothetical protein